MASSLLQPACDQFSRQKVVEALAIPLGLESPPWMNGGLQSQEHLSTRARLGGSWRETAASGFHQRDDLFDRLTYFGASLSFV